MMPRIESPFMQRLAGLEREARRVRRLELGLALATGAAVCGWVLLLVTVLLR